MKFPLFARALVRGTVIMALVACSGSPEDSSAPEEPSSEGDSLQAPTAPANLSSPSKSATSVSLSWSASTDNVVAGGANEGGVLATTVLFDPTVGANPWIPAPPLSEPRFSHTATLLPSGEVLIAGGHYDGQSLVSAELYRP